MQVPALILLASIRLARFGIDCTGPAVASEAREPVGVPGPWVGHHARGGLRPGGVAVVEDHAVGPTVLAARRVTVPVLGLRLARGDARHGVQEAWSAGLARVRRRVWSGPLTGVSRVHG